MLVTLFASLLIGCSAAAGNSDTGRKPAAVDRGTSSSIPIDVFAPSDISEKFVQRVFAETDAIWEPAGITFTWHRVTGQDATEASRLSVTIEKRRLSATESHTALGWITFTGNEPDPAIHLSIAGAEDMLLGLEETDSTLAVRHDFLIERALGRALSHEIGHYFFLSKAHTARGLMRAMWPPSEIFGEVRRGFELSAAERDAVAPRLRSGDRMTTSDSHVCFHGPLG